MTSEFDTPSAVLSKAMTLIREGNVELGSEGLALVYHYLQEFHSMAHDIAQGKAHFDYRGHRVQRVPPTDHYPSLYRPTLAVLKQMNEWLDHYVGGHP
ncbi:MAG: hypothetical protein KGI98_14905 [Euryarchaeota archaeon]|nr:hypothetical protein [Euryarchaeota archaeon]MDE1879457.1 hypothetical protein [Euryarchaeota archaeon]